MASWSQKAGTYGLFYMTLVPSRWLLCSGNSRMYSVLLPVFCQLLLCHTIPFSDLSETLVEHSALSVVDGRPWDMHRPLEGDCELQLKSFHDLDPFHVNKAFWRSCSFLLGYACESVFGENVPIKLHSFPPPNGMYQFYGCAIPQRCNKNSQL